MEEGTTLSYFKKIPGSVLIICSLHLFFYLISIFSPGFVLTLTCIPFYTIAKLEIWRLITSAVIPFSLLNLIICILSFWSSASQTEKRFGSVKYLIFFISNCIQIQVLYLLLALLINSLWMSPFQAIWGEIMIEIMLISNKNPESPMSFLCCPGKIKSAYYPYLFFAIFAILGYWKELLCGVIIGFFSK